MVFLSLVQPFFAIEITSSDLEGSPLLKSSSELCNTPIRELTLPTLANSHVCLFFFSAVKVNCNGFCGITSKVNDTTWTMEEQYFNSTISVADKGMLLDI